MALEPLAKYWLKFSSPWRVVPHGVVPSAQLLSVPRTLRPVGSTEVLSRALPSGRAGHPELARGVQTAVEVVPGDRSELAGAVLLLDDHDGQAVRGPGDLDLLAGRVGGVVAAEHQDFVGVLVVGDEDTAVVLPAQRQQGEEVVVVAELTGLGLRRLLLGVEGGGAAEDRLAPADDDVLGVTGRNGDLVGGVGRDGGEAQTAGAVGLAGAVPVAVTGAGLLGTGDGLRRVAEGEGSMRRRRRPSRRRRRAKRNGARAHRL